MRRLLIILIVLLFCTSAQAAITKTETTQAQEWVEIPGGAAADGTDIITTSDIDVSGAYSATLHIDCCISSTTAHTGTEIIVQIASEAGVDDAWTTWTQFVGPTGTAVDADFAAQEAAGQTVLSITNPVTENIDNDGKFIFIEAATVANSQIAYQIASGDDAADTITINAGLTAQQETTSDVFSMDSATGSPVGMYAISIPASASQARVIFNNNYDADGSTVHVRVRATLLTAL